MLRDKKRLSAQEVLSKLMKYCSYQERSEFEVKQKLREFTLGEKEKVQIIEALKQDDFLNEQRFAEAFVRGKLNVKRWGIYKIREGLLSKGVSSELSSMMLDKIDPKVYQSNLDELIERKAAQVLDATKLYRFLLSKGYETDLIIRTLKRKKLME